MYTPELTRQIQLDTQALLQRVNNIAADDLSLLRNALRFHEYRYYILNDPLLADYEYDLLYKQLEKAELEHPELITPDSPTQRVGKGLTK